VRPRSFVGRSRSPSPTFIAAVACQASSVRSGTSCVTGTLSHFPLIATGLRLWTGDERNVVIGFCCFGDWLRERGCVQGTGLLTCRASWCTLFTALFVTEDHFTVQLVLVISVAFRNGYYVWLVCLCSNGMKKSGVDITITAGPAFPSSECHVGFCRTSAIHCFCQSLDAHLGTAYVTVVSNCVHSGPVGVLFMP
jgi:hypothetical protein